MAKKKKNKQIYNATPPTEPASAGGPTPEHPGGPWYALRETIESIVIAFVLAFLFRTFEAEAFVIPTGSMSPSLLGQHKDVDCTECGYRFRTTASSEGEDHEAMLALMQNPNFGLARRKEFENRAHAMEVVAGMCPMCRQTMAMRTDLPRRVPPFVNLKDVQDEPSYPGDRILVNKFTYNDREPDRWDVVVFKFPGNGEMNYIKRLIGLSNETLRVYQGDIFIRDDANGGDFKIARKPPDKVAAMLQPVHDTDYDASTLYNAGWPLRWNPTSDENGWLVTADVGPQKVDQRYTIAPDADESSLHWLRYQNFVPQQKDWAVVLALAESGSKPGISAAVPELIRDFNAYNAVKLRGQIPYTGWEIPDDRYEMHWVGDLAVECEVEVKQAAGELQLDLVEAGQHFTCLLDLATGEATLAVEGFDQFSATTKTSLDAGSHTLRFANVDDQLLLWIDGDLVAFSNESAGLPYDADVVFDDRKNAIPTTSESDPADLAPVGIGARGASLEIERLQVLRDIYYIATNSVSQASDYPDYHAAFTTSDGERLPGVRSLRELFTQPDAWQRFAARRSVDFPIGEEQLFVMGDNSPASQDARLWATPQKDGTYPGGSYLDRRLLIGKAVCVFWPHSWGSFPLIKRLPGFPNFGDMRLVR